MSEAGRQDVRLDVSRPKSDSSSSSSSSPKKGHGDHEKHSAPKKDKKQGKNYKQSAAEKEAARASAVARAKASNEFIEPDYLDLVKGLKPLADEQQAVSTDDWKLISRAIPDWNAVRMRKRFSKMRADYVVFDPSETNQLKIKRAEKAGNGDAKGQATFEKQLQGLLQVSGFQEVPEAWLTEAKDKEGALKLNVHLPTQKEVEVKVFYREMEEKEENVRSWKRCFRQATQMEKTLVRMIMVFRYHIFEDDKPAQCCDMLKWRAKHAAKRAVLGPPGSEGKIFIRSFKQIPMLDLDILWPGAQPNPKPLDVLLVVVPFLIGIGSAIYKIYQTAAKEHIGQKFDLILFLTLIVLPFSVAFKAYSKAKSKYTNYRMKHAQILVNSTVAVDRGAIMQLFSEASEQEEKEFLLAYSMLAFAGQPLLPSELKQRVSAFLTKIDPENVVDFDVEDALEDLARTGLLVQADDDPAVTVAPSAEAAKRLVTLAAREVAK